MHVHARSKRAGSGETECSDAATVFSNSFLAPPYQMLLSWDRSLIAHKGNKSAEPGTEQGTWSTFRFGPFACGLGRVVLVDVHVGHCGPKQILSPSEPKGPSPKGQRPKRTQTVPKGLRRPERSRSQAKGPKPLLVGRRLQSLNPEPCQPLQIPQHRAVSDP